MVAVSSLAAEKLAGRHRYRAHLGEASWVLVAQAFGVVASLASIKVATNYLGPADYGRFAAALAVAGIIQLCLHGAISQTAARFLFLAQAKNSLNEYFRTLAVLMGVAIVVVLMIWGLAHVLGLSTGLAVSNQLLFLYVTACGSQLVLVALLNAGRARKAVALANAIDALGRPLVIILAVVTFMPSPTVVLGAYTVSAALVVGVLVIALLRLRDTLSPMASTTQGESEAEGTLALQMMGYAFPFVLFGVVGALGTHGERLLLTAWLPWEQVGVYALMSQLAITPTMLLMNLINQFYLPVIFHQDPEGRANFAPSFRRYLLVSAVGTAVLAVAVLVLGPYLVWLISSKAFLGHEHLLVLLVISAGLFGMAQQLVLPGLRALRSFIYIVPKIIHSTALLASAYLLVTVSGLDGMAMASIAAALLYLVAVVVANTLGHARR